MSHHRIAGEPGTDDSDADRTSRRQLERMHPLLSTYSPNLIGTIVVLVLCVLILLLVAFRQQSSSPAAEFKDAPGTSGGPSTRRGIRREVWTTQGDHGRRRPGRRQRTASGVANGGSSGSLPRLVGEQLLVDFSTFRPSDTVEGFLTQAGLTVSDWQVAFTPIAAVMNPANVDIVDGALRHKVAGQRGTDPVQSAEVATAEQNILFGKASPVEGVCHGFFYHIDHREVDIELLTSYYTKGRGDSVRPGFQYTTHPLTADDEKYNEMHPYPWDPTADFHDYTVEWTAEETTFSLDDDVIARITANVPQKPMSFNWNSWTFWRAKLECGPAHGGLVPPNQPIAANWTA